MSKLYDTLEKIRKNEAVPNTTGGVATAPHAVRDLGGLLKTTFIIAIGIALISTAYLAAPRIGALINKNNHQTNAGPTSGQPTVKLGQTTIKTADRDNTSLNKQAVALIRKDHHWQAIRLLLQANNQAPGKIEPLINLGVAFSELGLYGPANRYFSLAYGLEPGNIMLRQNMAILRAAGLLEQPLSFYFSSSEMGMGKDR